MSGNTSMPKLEPAGESNTAESGFVEGDQDLGLTVGEDQVTGVNVAGNVDLVHIPERIVFVGNNESPVVGVLKHQVDENLSGSLSAKRKDHDEPIEDYPPSADAQTSPEPFTQPPELMSDSDHSEHLSDNGEDNDEENLIFYPTVDTQPHDNPIVHTVSCVREDIRLILKSTSVTTVLGEAHNPEMISNDRIISDLEAKMKEKDAKLQELEGKLAEVRKDNEGKLRAKDETIDFLNITLQEKDKIIQEKENTIEEVRGRLSSVEKENAKDKKDLETKIEKLQKEKDQRHETELKLTHEKHKFELELVRMEGKKTSLERELEIVKREKAELEAKFAHECKRFAEKQANLKSELALERQMKAEELARKFKEEKDMTHSQSEAKLKELEAKAQKKDSETLAKLAASEAKLKKTNDEHEAVVKKKDGTIIKQQAKIEELSSKVDDLQVGKNETDTLSCKAWIDGKSLL